MRFNLRNWLNNHRKRRAENEARRRIVLQMMEDMEYWLIFDGVWILNTEAMQKDPYKVLFDARASLVKKILTGDGRLTTSLFTVNPTNDNEN